MDDLDKYLAENLQNTDFQQEWKDSQLEFDITEMLIAARNEQNLTQESLAQKAGIRQSNLSRIERGQCMPSLDTLQKIAHGLGKKLQIRLV